MKQAQPSTATLEAALRPLPARKTATGVFDTWSGSNLWERQTFSDELQWGVRYSQSDPLGEKNLSGHANNLRVHGKNRYGLPAESSLFTYSDLNPVRRTDPLGLYSINENCQGCGSFLPGITKNKQLVIAGVLLTKRLIQNGCIGQNSITRCMLDQVDPSSELTIDCPQPGDKTRCDDNVVGSSGFHMRKAKSVHICPRSFPTSPYGVGASEHEVADTFFEELAHVCGAIREHPDQGELMAKKAFSNYFSGNCGN
jgi:hypothetical protein